MATKTIVHANQTDNYRFVRNLSKKLQVCVFYYGHNKKIKHQYKQFCNYFIDLFEFYFFNNQRHISITNYSIDTMAQLSQLDTLCVAHLMFCLRLKRRWLHFSLPRWLLRILKFVFNLPSSSIFLTFLYILKCSFKPQFNPHSCHVH